MSPYAGSNFIYSINVIFLANNPGSCASGHASQSRNEIDWVWFESGVIVRLKSLLWKTSATLCIWASGLLLCSCVTAQASPVFKPSVTFQEAQRCRINGTVDFGCFQQKLGRFEQFVLQDDAGWLQKSIVAEALVKTYDAMHITSPTESAVRAKAKVYSKANEVLDKSEQGEIDDCKDEANPDGCLKTRYCFKEAYIKVKNVLVTNEPEKFQAEIKWFEREIKGNC